MKEIEKLGSVLASYGMSQKQCILNLWRYKDGEIQIDIDLDLFQNEDEPLHNALFLDAEQAAILSRLIQRNHS